MPATKPAPASYGAAPSASSIADPTADWTGAVDVESGAADRTGTIFSSVMNLCACALGASMLSLPYAMTIGGPAITLGLLTVFAVLAFVAGENVVAAGRRSRTPAYAAIVSHAYGPAPGVAASALLATALLVAGVSYICGLADLLPKLVAATGAISRPARIISILLLVFPATLIGSLAAFGPVSAIAVVGCYVQVAAVVAELFHKTGETDTWSVPPLATLLSVDVAGLVYVSPMLCFVYAYHYVLTDTLDELSDPTPARMTSVNALTVSVLYLCYLPLSIAGYLNYSGVSIPANMLTDLNEASAAVVVARIVIAALLLGTYSLFIIPLRRKVEALFWSTPSASMTDPKRLPVAAGLAVLVAAFALSLPDLSVANSVAGGAIALVMFLFPGLLELHGQFGIGGERNSRKIVVGASLVITGVVVSFVGLFGGLIFNY